jgi:heme-degrading monooxygenase HmoA
MWAQMISVRVKEGGESEILRVMDLLRAIEQPDSGLIRHLVLRDQNDPLKIRTLAIFESEEKARSREADPRRHDVQVHAQEVMAKTIEGPPTFDNLEVLVDFTY